MRKRSGIRDLFTGVYKYLYITTTITIFIQGENMNPEQLQAQEHLQQIAQYGSTRRY